MWCISTRGLACINSLAQAAKVWDAAKPWRNEHASFRLLDGPRMHHKRIVKLSEGKGYECVLFSTPMVTYLADGSVKLRCDDRKSSSAFAWCVAPNGCRPVSHKGCMFWRVATDNGDCYYEEGKEALHLRPTAAGNWELVNKAAPQTEWAFDRKLGAQARKLVAPYTLWYTISQRLGMELPAYIQDQDCNLHSVIELLADYDNPAVMANVAPLLGHPDNARNSAYLHLGVRYKVPAPTYRLPKN